MTDDLDRIMAIMQTAFDPAYGEAWTRRQVGDALVLPNTAYLLAAIDGEAPSADRAAAGFLMSRGAVGEEELLLIAVIPEARRMGVGTALLHRFAAEARERGSERLFLEMREGNPAGKLYTAFGFEPVGRRRNYYRAARSGPLDAITYAITL